MIPQRKVRAADGSSPCVICFFGFLTILTFPRTVSSSPGSGPSVSRTSPATSVETPSGSSVPATPETSPASATMTSAHRNQSGPVAGGVVGGVLIFLILFALLPWYCRRRVTKQFNSALTEPSMLEAPASFNLPLTPDSTGCALYRHTRALFWQSSHGSGHVKGAGVIPATTHPRLRVLTGCTLSGHTRTLGLSHP